MIIIYLDTPLPISQPLFVYLRLRLRLLDLFACKLHSFNLRAGCTAETSCHVTAGGRGTFSNFSRDTLLFSTDQDLVFWFVSILTPSLTSSVD